MRRRVVAAAAAVAVVVVATAVVVLPRSDSDGGARVGDVFDSTDEVVGTTTRFDLPPGTFQVTVAPPTRAPELEPFNAQVPTQAAEGSSYVAVSWGWTELADAYDSLLARTYLVVDGRRYAVVHHDDQLDDPSFQSSAAIVVPGESPDVTVEVDYDGLTQRAGDDGVEPGPADRLSGPETTTEVDAYATGAPDGFEAERADDDVIMSVRRTTYLADLGWAAEGKDYVVATLARNPGTLVDLEPEQGGEVAVTYTVTAFGGRLTLADGDEGTRLDGQGGQTSLAGVVERRAWLVDAGSRQDVTADVRSDLRLDFVYGASVPRRLRLSGSATVSSDG